MGPVEALTTFQLPEGFRIELVAAEPQVVLGGLAEGLKGGAKRRIVLSGPAQQMLLTLIENDSPAIHSSALGIAARIAFEDKGKS